MFEPVTPSELITRLTDAMAPLPDLRKGKNKQYQVKDALWSAYSVFFMQSGLFLAHQRLMQTNKGKNNLKSLFGVTKIPCDNQIRALLDPVPAVKVSGSFQALQDCLNEHGGLEDYRCFRGGYLTAIDGTEYFCSSEIHCPQCSVRVHQNGQTSYFHQVVTPVLVKPGAAQVLNLAPEFIRPQDGHDKQDCETNAAKRWLTHHPIAPEAIPVTLLGDDLYCINNQTVEATAEAGRGRWKVENENNNVLKTKGYDLEHNFGHGQENLAEILVCLNLLAFLTHTVLEIISVIYQQVRTLLVTRRDFFRDLRALTRYLYFDSWSALLSFMLAEGANSS